MKATQHRCCCSALCTAELYNQLIKNSVRNTRKPEESPIKYAEFWVRCQQKPSQVLQSNYQGCWQQATRVTTGTQLMSTHEPAAGNLLDKTYSYNFREISLKFAVCEEQHVSGIRQHTLLTAQGDAHGHLMKGDMFFQAVMIYVFSQMEEELIHTLYHTEFSMQCLTGILIRPHVPNKSQFSNWDFHEVRHSEHKHTHTHSSVKRCVGSSPPSCQAPPSLVSALWIKSL